MTPRSRAIALDVAGLVAVNQGDYVQALTFGEAAAAIWRELGDWERT